MAAVLACGPGELLSHISAAALRGLLQASGRHIDVTVPGRVRREVDSVRIHRPRTLPGSDAATHDGIPVTTVARTLLNLAGVIDERRLTRAWEAADRHRLLDVRAVQWQLETHPNARGSKALRALVAGQREAQPTRSDFESLFLDLCRLHRIDPPQVNATIGGFEVDAAWRDRKLVVELDSYAYHGTRAAFERDRHRDAELQLAGYRVVRFTYRTVVNDPETVARTIRRLHDPVA
jgi:very-short-patch-repair endonuclease